MPKNCLTGPEAPNNVTWAARDQVQVTWSCPEHTNGKLGGYKVECGRKDENKTLGIFFTSTTTIVLPVNCREVTHTEYYWVRVSAYNYASQDKLFGAPVVLSDVACEASKSSEILSIFL